MRRLAIFSALALAACAPPPAVVEYNGDSVRIKSSTAKVDRDVLAEAQRICRDRGLKPEYASSYTIPGSLETVHLFLCMNNPKRNAGLSSDLTRAPMTGRASYLESNATF